MITKDTAYQIACTHQEIERAEELIKKVREDLDRHREPDIRDAFGRQQRGLQLGIPSGDSSHRLYQVDWKLCVPVLMAHIGDQKARLAALCEVARTELDGRNACVSVGDPVDPGPKPCVKTEGGC
jgi:hypothetical protein